MASIPKLGVLLFLLVLLSDFSTKSQGLSFAIEKVSPKSFLNGGEILKVTGGIFDADGIFQVVFASAKDGGKTFTSTKLSCERIAGTILNCKTPSNAPESEYLVTLTENVAGDSVFFPTLVRKYTLPTITNFTGGSLNQVSTYSVAGGKELTISSDGFFVSSEVVVRFESTADDQFIVDVPGKTSVNSDSGIAVVVNTPAWKTPVSWMLGCEEPDKPVKSGTCVPDLPAAFSVSLDGGENFSPSFPITFGYVPKMRLAFLFPGPVNDFGWTYQMNKGRVYVESIAGANVDATLYYESVPEGEFALHQENKGHTVDTGTPVPEFFEGGVTNNYYPAFKIMKDLCENGVHLVFTCSFGYYSQTIDIAKHPNCSGTRFISVAGIAPTKEVSVSFAKIYQMRYLSGLVAGAKMKEMKAAGTATPCVGYLIAFPIPETQRGVNAFLLGCRAVYPECQVKAIWTGTWSDPDIERSAAEFLWEVGQCKVIAQHSDTEEPQLFYASKHGTGIGYNSDTRFVVGDSVLTSPLFFWGVVFNYYIQKLENGVFDPSEFYWPGSAEGAVDLAPYFSPLVSPSDQEMVRREKDELDTQFGDTAFRSIFCGPLYKRWIYKTENIDNTGKRELGCGWQPRWVRLENPEQLNVKHYTNISGGNLAQDATPSQTDCLDGVNYTGQALLESAFPNPFSEDSVYNDYLLDGIELFDPQESLYGQVFGEDSPCETEFGPTGDRFFKPVKEYPLCDGSQWMYQREACNPKTFKTPVSADFIIDVTEQGNKVPRYCGEQQNDAGKIVQVSVLPYYEDGPACDFLTSSRSIVALIFACIAAIINGTIAILLFWHRNNLSVKRTQPFLVLTISLTAMVLNLASVMMLGEPRDGICIARTVILNLCFTFIFAVLWAKIYRVYIIFQKKLKRVSITIADSLKIALAITAVDVVIIAVWMGVDPPMVTVSPLEFQGIPGLTQISCSSESNIFEAMSMLYIGMILLSACVLVYASRKIPAEFVEHKYILFAAYNTAALAAIILPFQLVSSDQSLNHLLGIIITSIGSVMLSGSLALPSLFVAFGMIKVSEFSFGYSSSSRQSQVERSQVMGENDPKPRRSNNPIIKPTDPTKVHSTTRT